jgi:hypothetical protein
LRNSSSISATKHSSETQRQSRRPHFKTATDSILSLSRLQVVLGAESGVRLETDSIDADEAVGIGGVVVKDITATLNVHAGQIGIVQRLRAAPALDDAVALVELDLHHAFHVALGEFDRIPDEVHLWCEPEAVVAEAGKFQRHRLRDALDLAIHGDALQVHVGRAEQGAPGSLVHPAALDPHEAIFDNVDAPDPVLAGDHVAVEENFERVRLDSAVGDVGDLDRNSLAELDLDRFGAVRGRRGRPRHLEHAVVRTAGGIFEHTGFVARVEEILVDAVVGLGLGIDRDLVLVAVGEEVAASLEALDEFGIAPRRNALDGRIEGLAAHFKANLVVALAGGTVTDEAAALLVSDADHLLGDAGAGNRRSEQVPAFVEGVALDRFKDVVLDKLFAQVGNDALDRTDRLGLRLDGGEVLFELPNVGAEGDHVKSLFAQPFENDGGIQTARVGEEELGFAFWHGCWRMSLE